MPASLANNTVAGVGGAHILAGSKSVNLQGAQLTAVGRDNVMNINNHYSGLAMDPMQKLRSFCNVEAMHDSETAAYAPRCKPGTRTTILGDIMSWTSSSSNGPRGFLHLLWLSGPAGGGKTCIQREIVQRCEEEGILAASYFFSTRVSGLDTASPFVATIVLQLCKSIPGLQPFVEDEISGDPTVFEKSIELQVERLVLQPIHGLVHSEEGAGPTCWTALWIWRSSSPQNNLPLLPKVIVIDGLDECRNPKEQVRIIRMLASALAKASLPIRVIIASRPEYDIRSTFDEKEIESLTHRIKLEDYGCDTDIEDYLVDSLFDIRKKHPSGSSIPSDWPSRQDVQKLVEKASGQFIYASTFLQFINNPRRDLMDMFSLAINFHLSPSPSLNPFSDLDMLYTIILESTDVDIEILKTLLHGIMVSGGKFRTTDTLDRFFRLKPGTSVTALCDLHSIIHVPTSHSPTTRFHHKSIEDYLLSPERAGKFHQPLVQTHQRMFELCADHLLAPSGSATNYASSEWMRHAGTLLELDLEVSLEAFGAAAALPELEIKYRRAVFTQKQPRNHFSTLQRLGKSIHTALCSRGPDCIQVCKNIVKADEIVTMLEDPSLLQYLVNVDNIPLYVDECMAASEEDWAKSMRGNGLHHVSPEFVAQLEAKYPWKF
ncbi:hypothetical protein FA15DRAFT_676077 [Coprinopsis marcescibilis]|uniref:Nephrocystin 3-like N-terminal domain-containing protein n=1 Tax=Coprinopsis marcescibilis TaxID=230819 RepID=A0A5C3KCM4_COPMA|nr:hypothetical protein FA15DRAFT_676077 [Coprinopsis marcescibilis]